MQSVMTFDVREGELGINPEWLPKNIRVPLGGDEGLTLTLAKIRVASDRNVQRGGGQGCQPCEVVTMLYMSVVDGLGRGMSFLLDDEQTRELLTAYKIKHPNGLSGKHVWMALSSSFGRYIGPAPEVENE